MRYPVRDGQGDTRIAIIPRVQTILRLFDLEMDFDPGWKTFRGELQLGWKIEFSDRPKYLLSWTTQKSVNPFAPVSVPSRWLRIIVNARSELDQGFVDLNDLDIRFRLLETLISPPKTLSKFGYENQSGIVEII